MTNPSASIAGLHDEALQGVPHEAAPCMTCIPCVITSISDEALDAPEHYAAATQTPYRLPCSSDRSNVSDEALDILTP